MNADAKPDSGSGSVARTVGPPFKLIFLSVLILTVTSVVASLGLSLVPPTDATDRVLEAALTTWKLGFGALVGLLGGKSL